MVKSTGLDDAAVSILIIVVCRDAKEKGRRVAVGGIIVGWRWRRFDHVHDGNRQIGSHQVNRRQTQKGHKDEDVP